MNLLGLLAFASLAAIGNAIFAAGQKKSVGLAHPFTFNTLSATICLLLMIILAPVFGPSNYSVAIKSHGYWAILGGVGLFITYLGFNLLYSKYGVSSYILYAVLSIVSTSIIVGVVIFKENFNTYHWLALISSILTIVLFTIGNSAPKN